MFTINMVYDFIQGMLAPLQEQQFLKLEDSVIKLNTTNINNYVTLMVFYFLLGICYDYNTYSIEKNKGIYSIKFYCNKFSVILYNDFN